LNLVTLTDQSKYKFFTVFGEKRNRCLF